MASSLIYLLKKAGFPWQNVSLPEGTLRYSETWLAVKYPIKMDVSFAGNIINGELSFAGDMMWW